MGKYHFVNEYLVNCPHLITVQVIGCGGTGSQMLNNLAKIHTALVKTGRKGLYVEAIDNDVVSEANIARQSFFPGDIGKPKSTVLISRLNRSLGLQWQAYNDRYTIGHSSGWNGQSWDGFTPANIIITCVDNVSTRLMLEKECEYMKRRFTGDATTPLYWLDMGNLKNTGQVVLGTFMLPLFDKKKDSRRKLPRITEMYDFSKLKDDNSGPSCSTMEALEKQDLFINSNMALWGADILWKLLFDGKISYRGVFVNAEKGIVTPIPV